MQTNGISAEEERRRYVTAFNSTMIKIWRERIALLKVIDTGALYRSVLAVGMTADGKVTQVTLSQRFNTYGIFQDYGTGREVPRGHRVSACGARNPGDISCKRVQNGACSDYAERSRNRCEANIGRDKVRQRRKWFSTKYYASVMKYYASVMNLKEFFADNLGRDFTGIVANALNNRSFFLR